MGRWSNRVVVLAGLLLWPSTSRADPIEFVEQRAQYMIFEDPTGALSTANWFTRDPFLAAYGDVEAGFLAEHPDDSQFLIVFTTWSLPAPVGALYQSVANDVHGIGYEHIAPLDAIIPEPYFDDTPNSQVQGFMHMNDWTNYIGQDPGGVDENRISLVFGQELGHAWLAFVHFSAGGVDRSDMLGRAQAHWSFYMHSGGSPVEGHDWIDNADGTFTAIKHDIFTFSDLDLYLMGLMPARQVAPWFILENVSNCVDSALKDGSCAPADGHQFTADSYTVTATRRDITIDDVVAAQGPRVPAFGEAPSSFDAAFVLVTRPGEVLSAGEKAQLDTIVARSIEIFDEQTRGLGGVVNRTASTDGGGDGGSGADEGTDGGPGGDAGDGAAGSDGDNGGSGAEATDGGSAAGVPTSSAGAAGPSANGEGCGCHTDPTRAPGSPWGWMLAGLTGALVRRARRPLA